MKKLKGILLGFGIAMIMSSCATKVKTVYVDPFAPPPVSTTIVTVVPIAPPALVITTGPGGIRRPGSGFM
jgi:hypothetical protein